MYRRFRRRTQMYVTSHYLTLNPDVMKQTLLLAVLSMGLLSACSTAFKTGQTPDDVYYSPGREMEYVVREERQQQQQQQEYREYLTSLDDRYLRMKIANRYRWGAIDDFNYWYDSRYDFSSFNYYSGINPYYGYYNPGWNLGYGYSKYGIPGTGNYGWSSPYYTIVKYSTPKYSGSTSGSNITAYRNKSYNNSNYGYRDPKTGNFIPSGNNNSFGNLLKRVFTGSSENNTSSSFDRPTRSFSTPTPSSTPQTSSSAGGTSGGFQSTGTSTSTGRGGRG